MEQEFIISRKKLITPSFEISFEYRIQFVIVYDNIYVVMLDISDEEGRILSDVINNIYGISCSGDILWQISAGDVPLSIYERDNAFVGISLTKNNVFHAKSFFSGDYFFDYKTGRMFSRKSGRW